MSRRRIKNKKRKNHVKDFYDLPPGELKTKLAILDILSKFNCFGEGSITAKGREILKNNPLPKEE